ncbi:hypothetical protein [Kitasatospora sp. NPDC094011]|uniref:hypothetical protein n=1 Tax=Kitasatospora sp. NPDC094011 TaxID=3364090 RepID=UPI00381AF709
MNTTSVRRAVVGATLATSLWGGSAVASAQEYPAVSVGDADLPPTALEQDGPDTTADAAAKPTMTFREVGVTNKPVTGGQAGDKVAVMVKGVRGRSVTVSAQAFTGEVTLTKSKLIPDLWTGEATVALTTPDTHQVELKVNGTTHTNHDPFTFTVTMAPPKVGFSQAAGKTGDTVTMTAELNADVDKVSLNSKAFKGTKWPLGGTVPGKVMFTRDAQDRSRWHAEATIADVADGTYDATLTVDGDEYAAGAVTVVARPTIAFSRGDGVPGGSVDVTVTTTGVADSLSVHSQAFDGGFAGGTVFVRDTGDPRVWRGTAIIADTAPGRYGVSVVVGGAVFDTVAEYVVAAPVITPGNPAPGAPSYPNTTPDPTTPVITPGTPDPGAPSYPNTPENGGTPADGSTTTPRPEEHPSPGDTVTPGAPGPTSRRGDAPRTGTAAPGALAHTGANDAAAVIGAVGAGAAGLGAAGLMLSHRLRRRVDAED